MRVSKYRMYCLLDLFPGWCDDSGDTHVLTCSAYSYYSRDPTLPNILSYPRYFFSDHDGRLLLEQGTLYSDVSSSARSVTLPRDGSFVFSVSGHYLAGGSLSWEFCGVSGGVNERVYFRTRHGICEVINMETVNDGLSCENEWTSGFLLSDPILPIKASTSLHNERIAFGVLEIVGGVLGLVALVLVVRRRQLDDDSRKITKFQSVDTTEHTV